MIVTSSMLETYPQRALFTPLPDPSAVPPLTSPEAIFHIPMHLPLHFQSVAVTCRSARNMAKP